MVRGEILRWLAAQLFSSLPCSGSFLHPSPYGGGAGFRLSWVCPARPQLPHTAPTGPFWGLAGIRSLLSFQNRTQGHTSPSLVLTVFSSCLFAQAEPPNPAPACNSPPPGWGGSCKEDSHFAPSLPLFLPSWAPCRSVASLPTAVCILQPC